MQNIVGGLKDELFVYVVFIYIFVVLITYIMNQTESITALKANESIPYGVGYKPFVVGALYINKMIRLNVPKTSGIYKIESVTNGKIYVGSASCFKNRKQKHWIDLKKEKHDNYKLQNHYNTYSIEDLIFKIIEVCSKEKLIEREQWYIDNWKPEFNISLIAGSNLGIKHTKPESKKRHADALLNRVKNETLEEYQIRCENCRVIKIQSLKEHPEQTEKISTGLKQYYKDHPEYQKQQSASRKGKRTGKDNPFYGKQHTEESKRNAVETRRKTGYIDTEKSTKQKRDSFTGKNNPLYGTSLFIIWTKRYGVIEAHKRMEDMIQKRIETRLATKQSSTLKMMRR